MRQAQGVAFCRTGAVAVLPGAAPAAVEQGLFPGNEQEVLRHAAAGEGIYPACLPSRGRWRASHAGGALFSVGDAVQFIDHWGDG